MSASLQTAIVLSAMKALRAQGSWCGETHIQKTLFISQELLDVPSNFKFILYKHGPYSFDLSEHIQGLIADDLVHVLTRPPYGPTLEAADEIQIPRNDSVQKRLEFIAQRLGRRGVGDLEKLATAVFVNRKYGSQTPVERRAEILSNLKPHVSVEAARSAFVEADQITHDARVALAA